jgi:NAD-dependent SIR2 family protein deacetylase
MNTGKINSKDIHELCDKLKKAEAVIVGAGAGLSTSAGLTYSGDRFKKHFSDFAEKYGIKDMYSGGFYPFETPEEMWAWWSRQIYYNRYDVTVGEPYKLLLDIVKDKDYFVITTNVDHQFQLAGFNKQRLFYTQGDYGLWQCSVPCHDETYDNYEQVKQMVERQRDMKIPSELVPVCPKCGSPMRMNLRSDDKFVQDSGWYEASDRYAFFLNKVKGREVLYLELGVGGNTPIIIKYPFWQAVARNKNATYACINLGEAVCPNEIAARSILIDGDIGKVLKMVKDKM